MKYLKLYEANKTKPKLYEYVLLCVSKNSIAYLESNWINSTVGQIIAINTSQTWDNKTSKLVDIKYYKVWFELYDTSYEISTPDNIRYISKNKEEVQQFLDAEKFKI